MMGRPARNGSGVTLFVGGIVPTLKDSTLDDVGGVEPR
jgi:hypothetical protein